MQQYNRGTAYTRWTAGALAVFLFLAAIPAAGDLNLGPEELVSSDLGVITVPGWSVPSFVYWNGDELKDLIVGEGGFVEPELFPGKVRIYLNEGEPDDPRFNGFFYARSDDSELTVPAEGCQGAFPRVVYWDADERKDLLVGQADGRIKLFLNINTDDDPQFDGGTFLQIDDPNDPHDPPGKIDICVGLRATPMVVDWNNDGRKDLVVGALDGRIHIFINEGTNTEPDFQTVQYAQENGADLVVPTERSSPESLDLDDDGRKDLLTGNTEGQLLFYRNVGTDDAPLFSGYVLVESDGVPIDLPPDPPALGPRSRPFVCDWTGDDLTDVLIGAGDGLTHLYQGVPELIPKWSQRLEDPSVNFDAASDLWWPDPDGHAGLPISKWEQLPNVELPGLNAHDWLEIPGGYRFIILADDWLCEGGDVLDLHWWGNYELDQFGQEIRGAGIDHFHLSIHVCGGGDPWCLPQDPPAWMMDVPFSSLTEVNTGMVNSEGSIIYMYEFVLPEPFEQNEGEFYWFDITAVAVDPGNPALWRWQEANRGPSFLCHAPAAGMTESMSWASISWSTIPESYSDMAFRITSGVIEEVNKVVADDFYSDGRPVEALRWWGSYFDERYPPYQPGNPLHQLDGWFITFHWASVNTYPECPPDLLYDPPPTALGVYFAPTDAVEIAGLDCMDCLGHALYEYFVDLSRCCLLCSEPDPRNGDLPAQPGAFCEQKNYRYWLSIQAVTGVEWIPPECQMTFTGHLPSDLPGNDGHFWGWHSTQPELNVETDEACAGMIMDFTPYPPNCWDYGEWDKQPYECPDGDELPVHMSFVLLAQPCVADVDGDGDTDLADLAALLAAYGSTIGDPNYNPNADFDNDGDVDLSDLAFLLADYGCGRFVQ